MRRLCLIVGLCAMLALPVCAQQSQEGTRDGAKAPGDGSAGRESGGEHQCGSGGIPQQFCRSGGAARDAISGAASGSIQQR